ncbi:Mo-co oxidoreductase dimerisation domain-containing protein [Kushneria avicenniae]|uniref:Mo-co oxidoreductase dimerisation domain-containing protein n=1 Tax=Kushneria avicenniae TaxID=402385 RepID=A0A1I1J9J6_9GAMM|nr:sulfite oxidase [Kushneria avicenniae]SFC45224.1 Mo-co oxidoreductase dimerisation domain-containing protein [Kushneria avicenniae]
MSHHPGIFKPLPAEYFRHPEEGGATNVETRLSRLPGYLTPNHQFFVRSHFDIPELKAADWQLTLTGDALSRSQSLNLHDLNQLPRVSVIRAIECAGNARACFARDFGRPAEGAQWGTGAVGVAEWSGVRLRDVLALAGLKEGAFHVRPEGLDSGRFARPLPIDKALADDTIIALAMNGEPLPIDHGFPARLVVSGWLGAASVKWLGRLEVSRHALDTYWNTQDYTLAGPDYPAKGEADGVPITTMPVMSMIELEDDARLPSGPTILRGRALSGEGQVTAVEYCLDDGKWQHATLHTPDIAGAWVCWSLHCDLSPGQHTISARATDNRGHQQPEQVSWNNHGCCYNAVTRVTFHIEDRRSK